MSTNNPLPYRGALMLYKAANVGEQINGQTFQPMIVTSLVNDRMVNGVCVPDNGGATVARVNVLVSSTNDETTSKVGTAFWPAPRFA